MSKFSKTEKCQNVNLSECELVRIFHSGKCQNWVASKYWKMSKTELVRIFKTRKYQNLKMSEFSLSRKHQKLNLSESFKTEKCQVDIRI